MSINPCTTWIALLGDSGILLGWQIQEHVLLPTRNSMKLKDLLTSTGLERSPKERPRNKSNMLWSFILQRSILIVGNCKISPVECRFRWVDLGYGYWNQYEIFYSIPVYMSLISIFDINWFPVFIVYTIYSIQMAFKNHYF